jgi:hypothetical protein
VVPRGLRAEGQRGQDVGADVEREHLQHADRERDLARRERPDNERFLAVFVASGWRPGEAFPGGATLAAASGAAFTAVVLGQVTNAFACRSTVQPVWRLSLRRNPLLLGAIAAELAMLLAFLYVPPIADLLDQSGPPLAGFAVALTAIPAVVIADALQKIVVRRRRARATGTNP